MTRLPFPRTFLEVNYLLTVGERLFLRGIGYSGYYYLADR